MANVLPRERRLAVLAQLVEGSSIRSTERITGVTKRAITRLMLHFGNGCEMLMRDQFRNLTPEHLQVDEIWSFVQKKQARLTTVEREERHDIGDVYLWTAIDDQTKLIAAHLVGKRSADNARRLMMKLADRIDLPNAHASDSHKYVNRTHRQVVRISTDGLAAYPEAIDLAFGPYAAHGVLIKEYRNANIRYTPSEMVGSQRRIVRGKMSRFEIVTSHVERHNLTIRTFMRRFTRLSLGFSKKLENHEAACSMFIAYYNYCWRTRYPNGSGQSGRRRLPSAMAAGIVDRLWRLEDLYNAVM